ncbi:MAG: pseudouridine synthase [SAR324 cluster bacterium]|uniref:Pseudouridine synthase n=1 Tax=SAR324 cluster bacterium TaxID=2024889 RepID=A0A2A4SV64_9DELT|nr:MAG: pseudouridine synthase [SAR324 cluster bacterium]
MQQSTSPFPSMVYLPDMAAPYPSILDFLEQRFPQVSRATWESRIVQGKVNYLDGDRVTLASPYLPQQKLCYYREVAREQPIPFEEEILFQNEHLLVVCKPHFVPVTPSGPYVNECLLYRLRRKTGIQDLVAIHRLDRETAGIILFSCNKETRALYCQLFRENKVKKVYEALGRLPAEEERKEWLIENRIVRGEPWFLSKIVEGQHNSFTKIFLLEKQGTEARFRLEPKTGKKHQLRLHLTCIGSGITNDRVYPLLQPQKETEDFLAPLQLLAKEIYFEDPVTRQPMKFVSSRQLITNS